MTKNLDYLENFYFEPTQTVYEKVGKLKEEYKEVIEAYEMYLEGKKTNSDVAQEILDTIHASINLLRKMDEEELITIETEIFKHSVKLGEYLESGKYRVRGEREEISELCKRCGYLNEINGMCLHYTKRMIGITRCGRFEDKAKMNKEIVWELKSGK